MKLAEWIDSLATIPADKKALIKESLGAAVAQAPELETEFHNGYLRQQDYSKNMNGLTTQKAALEEEFRKKDVALEAYKNTLVTTGGKMNKRAETMQRQRDAALARLQDVGSKLTKAAEENGLDLEELGIDLTLPVSAAADPANKNKKAAPVVDDNDSDDKPNYVTAEQLGTELVQYPVISAQINDAIAEFEELTGKRVRNATEIVTEAVNLAKSGKPVKLSDFLADKLELPKLRTERATKETAEREETIRREERQKTTSEIMAGNGRVNPDFHRNSPVLAFNDKQNANKPKGIADNRRAETAAKLQERALNAAKEYASA